MSQDFKKPFYIVRAENGFGPRKRFYDLDEAKSYADSIVAQNQEKLYVWQMMALSEHSPIAENATPDNPAEKSPNAPKA